MQLTFDGNHVRALLELSYATRAPRLSRDDLIDYENLRDTLPAARRALLQGEAREMGYCASTRPDDIDPRKILRGILVSGSRGVRIFSQAPEDEVRRSGINPVCLAREYRPGQLPYVDWQALRGVPAGPEHDIETICGSRLDAILLPGQDLSISFRNASLSIQAVPSARVVIGAAKGQERARHDQAGRRQGLYDRGDAGATLLAGARPG